MNIYSERQRDSFFNKIKDHDNLNVNNCWIWIGSFNRNYPIFCYNNKMMQASRIAYEMFHNIKISNLKNKLHHICENEKCVNPNHIKLGGTPEYFWSKVIIKNINECWIWMGLKDKDGYGKFFENNNDTIRSHRYVYTLYYGDIPENMQICHTCDTPECVNPNHLFSGTHQDNVNDKVNKNRQVKGENHIGSKLKESDIILIRQLALTIPHNKLAQQFNISTFMIYNIIYEKSWAHVPTNKLNIIPGQFLSKGESHGRAKLKDVDVIQIRQLSTSMSQQMIANQFKINQNTVSKIINRKLWKHI